MDFDSEQLALLQDLRDQLRDRSRLYQSGLQQMEASLTEIGSILATMMNEPISSGSRQIMSTKAAEDADSLKEDSDELVSMTVAPRVHGSATPPAKRRRSIKRKHHGFRSSKATSRSRSHSSKAESGVVSSPTVDGKRLQSLSSLMEFQNITLDRLDSDSDIVETLVHRAGIAEENSFDAGRANFVWKPGGLLWVNSQLSGLRRVNSDDVGILTRTQGYHRLSLEGNTYIAREFREMLAGEVLGLLVCVIVRNGSLEVELVQKLLSKHQCLEIKELSWSKKFSGTSYFLLKLLLVEFSGRNELLVAVQKMQTSQDLSPIWNSSANVSLVSKQMLKYGVEGSKREKRGSENGHGRGTMKLKLPLCSSVDWERTNDWLNVHYHEDECQEMVGVEVIMPTKFSMGELKLPLDCVLELGLIHLEDKMSFSGASRHMWRGMANSEVKKKLIVDEDHNWWAVKEYQETQSLSCVNELGVGSQNGLCVDVLARELKKIWWSGDSGASGMTLDDTFSFSNLEDQQLHNPHWLSLYKRNRGSKREAQNVEDEVKKNKNSFSRVVRGRSVMAMEGKMITGLHCFDYKIEEWLVTCQRFQFSSDNITIAGKKKHVRSGWCFWLPSQSKREDDLKGGFIPVLTLGNLMKTKQNVKAVNGSICCRLTILQSLRIFTTTDFISAVYHCLRPPEISESRMSCWNQDMRVGAKEWAAAAIVSLTCTLRTRCLFTGEYLIRSKLVQWAFLGLYYLIYFISPISLLIVVFIFGFFVVIKLSRC